MPTHEHEVIANLFLDDPSLVIDLLHDALGVFIPAGAVATLEDAALPETVPSAIEADRIVLLRRPSGDSALAVVVEVQRAQDPEKAWSWPAYLALARRRHRCLAAVLVVATDETTAGWARRPIPLDPDTDWTPYVVGPELVPRIVDAEVVKARPQLGVLSALAHRQSAADLPVLRAVSEGLGKSELSEKMVSYWWDVIWDDMGRGAQEAWEKFMQVPDNYEYKSDFARKYFGQGRHEAQRAAVLEVLDVRRIAVPPDARARIEACADSAQLKEWHRRAIFANSVEDLFSGASISVG